MNIICSEHFYSIQGEGRTMGIPAIFLRLTACNLMCGGRGTEKDKKLHHGATWRCDTLEVWRKGEKYTINQFVLLVMDNYETQLRQGAHLVITGGEPLLQQKAIEPFLERLEIVLGFKPFIEIETNGTISPKGTIFQKVDLFNCSPKLSNSGEPEKKRIKKEVLHLLNLTPNSIFKFVVSDKKDIEEIQDIINSVNIKNDKIYLMPSAENQKQLKIFTEIAVEECLKYGYNFSTRLQIIIWNETTGV